MLKLCCSNSTPTVALDQICVKIILTVLFYAFISKWTLFSVGRQRARGRLFEADLLLTKSQ